MCLYIGNLLRKKCIYIAYTCVYTSNKKKDLKFIENSKNVHTHPRFVRVRRHIRDRRAGSRIMTRVLVKCYRSITL